jgi:hypothetical protein
MRLWKLAALLVAIFGFCMLPLACGDDSGTEGEAEAEAEGEQHVDGSANEEIYDAAPPDSAPNDACVPIDNGNSHDACP